jgi:regulator of replication initiation timing
MLTKLKNVREALIAEIGDVAKIKEEKDAAIAENEKLRKEVSKLNYRIDILIGSLEEEEKKKDKS